MPETAVATEFSLPLRVYIEDTDAGGIVYYVNYLKYMERARTELMRWHGFGKDYIFSADLMFVVANVALDYRAPARLDDALEVSAELLEHGAAWMSLRQTVRRGEELLCSGTVKLACVRRDSMRPQRIPLEILNALQQGPETATE